MFHKIYQIHLNFVQTLPKQVMKFISHFQTGNIFY